MLLLILGGAIGTCARYGVGKWLEDQPWAAGFPWATLLVNATGSFLLAIAAVLLLERLSPMYKPIFLLLGTGFCGGYTTFSTFEWETFKLIREGRWGVALGYVSLSVGVGFLGVLLGVATANWIWSESN